MPIFEDQCQRTIYLPDIPRRIVSLVPSQTELLFDLGLEDAVVGITRYCVHPHSWFVGKSRVGGTKNIDFSSIRSLNPNLILANREENSREQVDALAGNYPVWVSDIHNLGEALHMIECLGILTGTREQAGLLCTEIATAFSRLDGLPVLAEPLKRAAYLIWQKPYMAAGGDTFISDMMHRCGLENIFGSKTRYPEVTLEQIRANRCGLLLLSSEPFPFGEKHIDLIRVALPDTRIILVDGKMFSWYGSRLRLSVSYLMQLREKIQG